MFEEIFKKLFKEMFDSFKKDMIEMIRAEIIADITKILGTALAGAPATSAAIPLQQGVFVAAQAEPEKPVVTREQVGAALVKLATTKNRDAAVGILAQFSATTLDQVNVKDYGRVVEAATLALSL